MYTLSINMWFQKLMKQFFFGIDQVVYNFISSIYDLLITIARTSVLSQADIMDMADRIYKLLAVFMIFKVTFSLIMYVVNPDDFSDKSKGVAKLGTNIIISLALLILTPYIFNYAYKLQTFILEDNSLATLIFGETDEKTDNFINTGGDKIAYVAMSGFLTPNLSIDELKNCTTLIENGSFNEECSGVDENYEPNGVTESLYELTKSNDQFTTSMLKNYVAGVENGNFNLMFRQDLIVATAEKNSVFIMEYNYIFSTVVGVVIILLLITFCMDVAVRSIKLAMLQLIAPIPIISYVDPKSGKDGLFKKWYQMCFKTYLSLFIRLLALYFAIYIIQIVADKKLVDVVDGSYKTGTLLSIFIIIGALMFAKQFPDILKGLGINLDGGGFTLNPLKKIEKDAIGGKQLSKAAAAPFKYAGRAAKGLGTAALVGGAAAVTGQGFRGTGKAFMGAMKGEKFGKNFSGSYSAARTRKKQVDEMRSEGVDSADVRRENFYNKFHGQTRAEHIKSVSGGLKAIQDDYASYIKTAAGVDAIAKDFDKRKSAAEAAGNYQEAKRWSDAFDQRIKEISQDSGRIIKKLESSFDAERIVSSNGTYTKSLAESHAVSGEIETNAALRNIAQHMDALVAQLNDQAETVKKYGYEEITGTSTVEGVKALKNQAQNSQQSVDTNEETRKINDVAKYSGSSKK